MYATIDRAPRRQKRTRHNRDPQQVEAEERERLRREYTIVGYEAQLFNDQDLVERQATGAFLQPWRDCGRDTVFVDRYDVRNLLDEAQLEAATRPYEPSTDPEDLALEEALDKLRYMDLEHAMRESNESEQDDMHLEESSREERSQHDGDDEEEVKKRQRLVELGRAFEYDYNAKSTAAATAAAEQAPPPPAANQTPFKPNFSVPEGMIVPSTQRQAEFIERTVRFLNASTDPQLEILIKAKQANNREFGFMDARHYLYGYYQHLRWMRSSGLADYASSSEDDEPANDAEGSAATPMSTEPPVPPPDDRTLKTSIDRVAEYIARSGDEFEGQLRARGQFAFLASDDAHYAYYRDTVKRVRRGEAPVALEEEASIADGDTDTPTLASSNTTVDMSDIDPTTVSTDTDEMTTQKRADRLAKARAWLQRKKPASNDDANSATSTLDSESAQ